MKVQINIKRETEGIFKTPEVKLVLISRNNWCIYQYSVFDVF